jgi:hypothetical protein
MSQENNEDSKKSKNVNKKIIKIYHYGSKIDDNLDSEN